jgi:P2-related tail formation protein
MAEPFASQLISRMQPWNVGPKTGSPPLTDLERYCKALGAMFEPALALYEETGIDGEAGYVPPWGRVFNPATCPRAALAYLAQFVGVSVPTGATEAEARALVLAHAGFNRGTKGSLETVIKRVIGAGEPFTVLERTGPAGEPGQPYYFLVYVGPGKATQALYNAIDEVRPAGVWFTITEGKNQWLEGVKAHWTAVTPAKWTEMLEGSY